MDTRICIGLVGDRRDSVVAHGAIPIAFELAARALGIRIDHEWVPTEQAASEATLARFDGIWCVPGSPYASTEGALHAIRYARMRGTPFLGTCGGFQHALIEYARNVLGWRDAEHGESSADPAGAVIAPLSCGVLDGGGMIALRPGTRIRSIYRRAETHEEYLCSYGVNPNFRAALITGVLRESAVDADGDLRAVELETHPFFVATLFQPERAALRGLLPPLVAAFVDAAAQTKQARSSTRASTNARNPIFIHYVHDMARARRFYESVFEVTPSFASGGWSTLAFGAFELALHILAPGHTDEAVLPHAGMNLQVDHIESMQARIESQGGRLIELREAQARVPDRVATFVDCEGNGFELRQPVRRKT